MSICSSCGAELPEGAVACPECGVEIPAAEEPIAAPVELSSRASARIRHKETMTTGGYLGSMFLLGLPVIGLIIAVVWACCGCRNIARRRYARAWLLYTLIVVLLVAVLAFVGAMVVTATMGDQLIPMLEQSGILEFVNGLGF